MNNKQIWRIGFVLIGICLVFISGFYFHAVDGDYDQECSFDDFDDWVAMENDFKCGDFGIYYFKFACLIAIGVVGAGIIYLNMRKENDN